MKSITLANKILKDQKSANKIPDLYENGSKKVKNTIDKWNIFKSVNYLISNLVNKEELLSLYKPTETSARTGSKRKIALPVTEYEKLKGISLNKCPEGEGSRSNGNLYTASSLIAQVASAQVCAG